MQPSCSSSQVGAKGEEEAERFLGAGQKERGKELENDTDDALNAD
jgi:hypothetical protein